MKLTEDDLALLQPEQRFFQDFSNIKNEKIATPGQVKLMLENDHQLDHKNTVQDLTRMINNERITSDSVICLERKEQGENFGMNDVRLLANILKFNEATTRNLIAIPNSIENSLIYQDAVLYNAATAKGISVIGVEGKGLKHDKDSPEYDAEREQYMAEQIQKILNSGKDVIFPVGSAHKVGLELLLGLNNEFVELKIVEENKLNVSSLGQEQDFSKIHGISNISAKLKTAGVKETDINSLPRVSSHLKEKSTGNSL